MILFSIPHFAWVLDSLPVILHWLRTKPQWDKDLVLATWPPTGGQNVWNQSSPILTAFHKRQDQ